MALSRERARFALRLPGPAGQPLTHLQALRLQCGTLAALRQLAGETGLEADALVAQAEAVHGSLADLPWETLVATLVSWQPPPRRSRRSP